MRVLESPIATAEVSEGDHQIWVRRQGVHEMHGHIRHDSEGQAFLYRTVDPRNIIRYLDGLAIDDVLLKYIEGLSVKELHYLVKGEDGVYVTTPDVVRKHAVVRFMGTPPNLTHILSRKHWDKQLIVYPKVDLFGAQVTLEDDDARP